MNETTVTVVGNIASQVTARRVGAEGHFLVGFRVASSERRWDKASGEWVDGDRFSAWVSCWRRLGEHVSATLVKGDPVVVHGRVSVREYEVNGERRYSTELAATSVGPDLNRCKAQVTRIRASSTTDGDQGEGVTADEGGENGVANGTTSVGDTPVEHGRDASAATVDASATDVRDDLAAAA